MRVDPTSGEVTGPFVLERPAGKSGEAQGVAATDDAVWVRWADGVTRFDPTSCEERSIPLRGGRLLAVGDEGVWLLGGDGRPARVNEECTRVESLGDREEMPLYNMAVGEGAVWALLWDVPSARSVLSRLDPSTGAVDRKLPIAGSPQALMVDRGTVWARLWRERSHRQLYEVLVGIAPSTMEVTSEIEISPTGAGGPVVDGEVWVRGYDSYSADRGTPAVMRRLDAATGGELGEVETPGRVDWLVAGPSSVWGCLERRGEWPWPLIELTAHTPGARVVKLEHLEVSPHLPPPPPRIEAKPVEEQTRDRIAAAFFRGWLGTDPESGRKVQRPYIRGVTFEDVRLEGEFPETRVVALFRSEDHPGVLFGRRRRVWDDDGSYSDVITVMDVNLMEDIEACGYGLPANPQPDESGVVWF